jgi:hypothetical protein
MTKPRLYLWKAGDGFTIGERSTANPLLRRVAKVSFPNTRTGLKEAQKWANGLNQAGKNGKLMSLNELQYLSYTNSDSLPGVIRLRTTKDREYHYRQWVGIGWIEIEPAENATEVIEYV